MTSPTTAKPTAAMINAYRAIMNFNERSASQAARAANRAREAKLQAECIKRGIALADMSDFA